MNTTPSIPKENAMWCLGRLKLFGNALECLRMHWNTLSNAWDTLGMLAISKWCWYKWLYFSVNLNKLSHIWWMFVHQDFIIGRQELLDVKDGIIDNEQRSFWAIKYYCWFIRTLKNDWGLELKFWTNCVGTLTLYSL